MKLYHGTSAKVANSILKDGLVPRRHKRSNWKDQPSHVDFVYLTDMYAPYYACNSLPNRDRAMAIFEIDLDKLVDSKLYPDEDFLREAYSVSLKEFQERMSHYQNKWRDSLINLGTCGYKGVVPVQAISRVAYMKFVDNPLLYDACLNPIVMIANHKHCSEKYIAITKWIFEETITVEDLNRGCDLSDMIPGWRDGMQKMIDTRVIQVVNF